MNKSNLWSLRLGFSSKQSSEITKSGITEFVQKSIQAPFENEMPDCLKDDPKTLAELKEFRQSIKNSDSEEQKKILKKQIKNAVELKNGGLKEFKTNRFRCVKKWLCFGTIILLQLLKKSKSITGFIKIIICYESMPLETSNN